jgi:N-acetyl-beta-hexosaminidase
MKNIPKKIYLNLGMDEIESENVKDFNELREVTWCEDRQSESDIEYQLFDNHLLIAEIKGWVRALKHKARELEDSIEAGLSYDEQAERSDNATDMRLEALHYERCLKLLEQTNER